MVASRPASAAADALSSAAAEVGAARQRVVEGLAGRGKRVVHRLVPGLGLPAGHDAVQSRSERLREALGVEGLDVPGRGGHAEEERAVERAAGATDRAHQGHPDALEQRGGVGGHLARRRRVVEGGDHGRHPAIHVGAVVGVTDRGVELGEELLVVADDPSELAHPTIQGNYVDGRP